VYGCWSRTLADTCWKTSSGRSWRAWASVSRKSFSSARAAVTRRQLKRIPLTPHFIVTVARGLEVAKVRSLTDLCSLRVSVETYVAPKGHLQCKRCQLFGHTQRYCGYAPRCVACGEAHLSGECSTPQQQFKCCSCGGNYTANYRGCTKWKEAKATLAKRAPSVRSKVGSAPRPPVTPKAQRLPNRRVWDKAGTTWSVGAESLRLTLHPLLTPLPVLSLRVPLAVTFKPPEKGQG
jgi:hypothetical protein